MPRFLLVSMPYQSNSLELITDLYWDWLVCPESTLRSRAPRTHPLFAVAVSAVVAVGLAYATPPAFPVSRGIVRHDLICRCDVFPWEDPFICIYSNIYLMVVNARGKEILRCLRFAVF